MEFVFGSHHGGVYTQQGTNVRTDAVTETLVRNSSIIRVITKKIHNLGGSSENDETAGNVKVDELNCRYYGWTCRLLYSEGGEDGAQRKAKELVILEMKSLRKVVTSFLYLLRRE